ncbi:MAG: hypothetical protein ACJAWH_001788 [Maribacter sp.]|jgi:hypothetical protein
MRHLSQANISCFSAPLDNLMMKEFVAFLDPITKRVEGNSGFAWRLKDEKRQCASYLESPFKNEMTAINISVWKKMESFKNYAYGSVHSYFLKNKKKWFDPAQPSQFIMWWIPTGEGPSLELTKDKLEYRQKHGDTPQTFFMHSQLGVQGSAVKLS